ncbi:MAG: VacJ family lipoprotein, partial [Alphaproteobacteria bacterium]
PLAELYRVMVPPGIRNRMFGIISNMREPNIFVNNVLQGEFNKAGISLGRLVVNSTLGIGGMWDVASNWDWRQQTGDFGQTLAVWGAGEGPYLMLPIYGPSNVRDAIGRGVDMAMSPWQYLAWMDSTTTLINFEVASLGADGIVRREKNIENIDALRTGTLDPYANFRSAYQQYRRKQVGQSEIVDFDKAE